MNLFRPRPYKGFESVSTRFSMALKMYLWTFSSLFLLHLFLIGFLTWRWVDLSPFGQLRNFILVEIWDSFSAKTISIDMGEGAGLQTYSVPEAKAALIEYMKPSLWRIALITLGTSPVYFLGPITFRFFKKISEQESESIHLRGHRVITAKELNRELMGLKE